MTSARRTIRTAKTATLNMKRAARNWRQSASLASIAGDVVTARTRMTGIGAGHGELLRMVPEKALAFSAAGVAYALYAMRAARQANIDTAAEWAATARQARTLPGTPLRRTIAQTNAAWSLWGRMMWRSVTLGASMMQAQYAVVSPILSTARANAARLRNGR